MNNSTFQFEPLHPETKPKCPKSKLAIAIFIIFVVIAITVTITLSVMQSDQENLGKIFLVNKVTGQTEIIDSSDGQITCNLPDMPRTAISWDGSSSGLINNTVLICGGIDIVRKHKETKDCFKFENKNWTLLTMSNI